MSSGSIAQLMVDTANVIKEQNKTYPRSSSNSNTIASTSSNQDTSDNNTREANDTLGKDAFLQLLVTQMKNQDPLEPMDNQNFIAQMAQFSSLEQMQNMNQSMESFLRVESLSQGAALVDKTVEMIDPETGQALSGVVEKVAFEGGEVFAFLDNGLKVNTNEITSIY
ncbi:MAG: flagellar hook capping FlgD N-terminal domain-containing protein [Halanaerobiales bacterium]